MITVIDYGSGNLFSLARSLEKLDIESEITSDKRHIYAAQRIILPGVGAFGDAAAKLAASGMAEAIKEVALGGVPLLGICLGMQLLFDKSYEYGEHKGLELIGGEVVPLRAGLRVPHMGWNSLKIKGDCPLFKYVKSGEYVYFVHSYHAVNCGDDVCATTCYGGEIVAAVYRKNIYGMQFHPEKSGDVGLKILKAFGEI